jgi:poly(A) polymerase
VKDFDIATSALPEDVAGLFEGRAKVLPTGIEHGTMTIVTGTCAIEITTFRSDVATDGRRAVVAYSKSIEEDAKRRDFTMNAIYVDRHGAIKDPVGGVADANKRILRFIGRPGDRIKEDYLRSLRFFRLFAEYGDPSKGFDPDAVAAIADNLDGLRLLSTERVTSEIMRLLGAPDPSFAVAGMDSAGVLAVVLPGAMTSAFFELVHLETETGTGPGPIRRLAALVRETGLRLSNKERRRFDTLQGLKVARTGISEIAWRYDPGIAKDVSLLRSAGLSVHYDQRLAELEIARGAQAKFPISASDLMPALSGPELGAALDHATELWIASDFTLDREALLSLVAQKG